MLIRAATVADAAAIGRVHVDCSREAYRGILEESYLEAFSYTVQQDFFVDMLRTREIFCYVAELPASGVVGFAAGCPERTGHPLYKGELYALYVLPEQQRHGFGRLLVLQVAERFHQAGAAAMLVWVLAENAAVHFYQRLGAKRIASRIIEIGGKSLEEVSFGWEDLRVLLNTGPQ